MDTIRVLHVTDETKASAFVMLDVGVEVLPWAWLVAALKEVAMTLEGVQVAATTFKNHTLRLCTQNGRTY